MGTIHSVVHAVLRAVQNLDYATFSLLNRYAGNGIFDRLASHEESNNLLKGALVLSIYIYLWFRMDEKKNESRTKIIAVLAGTFLALVVSRLIADLAPFRMRPIYNLDLVRHTYGYGISRNMENWSSFPSDTAAYFSALGFGLWYILRRFSVLIVLYTALWICLPRLFLGTHYLSDVIVGAAIGISCVAFSLRLRPMDSMSTQLLTWADTHPGPFYGIAFLGCFEMGALFDDIRNAARGFAHVAAKHSDLRIAAMIIVGIVCVYVTVVTIVWATRRHMHVPHTRT